jgi:L-aspartate oxidase
MKTSAPNIIDVGDVLVIGAGLAGLFTALKLAPRHVTVLSAGKRNKGSASKWAQGGIAAALGPHDSPSSHAQDTVRAGAGLVDADVAQMMAEEAAHRIDDLADFGVAFDRDEAGNLALGREAAHSHNRIIGIRGDRAGREIMAALFARAEATPSIDFIEGYAAYELAIKDGRVVGVFARPASKTSLAGPLLIRARAVILAMGGAGHLFDVTTNPHAANGEALAMAARAGAQIADAEFVQFHPTALTGMGDPAPLATEALRGEGAILVNAHGTRFMPDIHKDAELAPRDIVARAVFQQITETGVAGLDLRPSGLAHALETRFPTVYGSCVKAGIDPTESILPIAPAMHFHMGGIRTNLTGRTSLPGLWACGEVASTGVHGANRLASNSLLEAIVFGAKIAEDVNHIVPPSGSPRPAPAVTHIDGSSKVLAPMTARLRTLMTRHVGVLRSRDGLISTLRHLRQFEQAAQGLAPFANMLLAAQFITMAALKREESRGGHYRLDFPMTDATPSHTLMTMPQLKDAYDTLPEADIEPLAAARD